MVDRFIPNYHSPTTMSTTSLIAIAASPIALVQSINSWLGIVFTIMIMWMLVLTIFGKIKQ